MFANLETSLAGNFGLPAFDLCVIEFLDPPALQADQMIVVMPFVDLEDGPVLFEVVALEQAGVLELGQDPVYGGEADVHAFVHQHPVDILGGQVANRSPFEQFEHLEARCSRLEAGVFEITDVAHGSVWRVGMIEVDERFIDYHMRLSGNLKSPTQMCVFRGGLGSRVVFAAMILTSGLGACSSVPQIVTEYRIDVQQGNVVSQEMASQLKVGLTKDQVRFALGTPLLTDIFHEDRWDYVYRFEKGRTGEVEQRRFSVFFDKEGKLARVGGDVVPAATSESAEKPAPTADSRARVIDLGSVPEGTTAPAQEPEGKGFFGRMLEKIGL